LTLAELRKFFQECQKKKENEILAHEEKQQQERNEMNRRGTFAAMDKLEEFVIPESFAPGLLRRKTTIVHFYKKIVF